MNFKAINSIKEISANDAVVLFLFEGEKKFTGQSAQVLKDLSFPFQVLGTPRCSGKLGEVFSWTSGDKTGRVVIIVGLGLVKKLDAENWRRAVSSATRALRAMQIKSATLVAPKLSVAVNMAEGLAEAAELSAYEFLTYKKETEKRIALEIVRVLVQGEKILTLQRGLATGATIATAVKFTRDLANHPANVATPTHLAKHAVAMAKLRKLKYKIIDRAEAKKLGMGLFLSVAQGSTEPPKFIVVEYSPRGAAKKTPTIVFVGKGCTFDSGGISIKPSSKMEEMKYDMAGGAATLGIVQAAADLKLPVKVVAIIPASENLPSGEATKPGDVHTASNGKTVEIINTDAEGRLLMADALVYAKRYQPSAVIDLATLTGACVYALGDTVAGLLTNNAKLGNQVKAAAGATSEKVWELPIEDEYRELLKGDIADLRNVTNGAGPGTITAALFLQEFVDYPWAHLDIAGTAYRTSSHKYYLSKGATGFGVRLGVEFLRNFKN